MLVGIPLGYALARDAFPGRILLGVVNTGMGMPPVVVGLVESGCCSPAAGPSETWSSTSAPQAMSSRNS